MDNIREMSLKNIIKLTEQHKKPEASKNLSIRVPETLYLKMQSLVERFDSTTTQIAVMAIEVGLAGMLEQANGDDAPTKEEVE